ncbi:MAG: hypothetical protein JXB44_13005, partial [Calditrichaceae bacterium]|nr:hypothetical protein [Calditrichaceae bacterium]
GYWSKSDAAVVFKRLDRYTGDVRYIYHGNDGTSMPWNDTAQLNYLMPEVREAVVQTILHVARKFPVIRFDAAMTLAKKHYQRLWFPEPGHGGDIPSRAEHALSKEKFNELFPVEFWREVVDRVQQEAPDTLLLAEAFWMMEGYFVRSLGMHRVYNSAFMNMLKMEENYKYRQSIKNILEYNPQILKRYVNFMNNPDEETAIAQFGKDDKYFGVCMMMCTMPGLPMFGHGQIEGFGEKYGMEYRRAYWDEQPDQWLISRHEREIFPILKKRYLFSDVENFYLFDFYSHGHVNENVFAYLNRHGNEKGLVLYHNKYADARGWINRSAAFKDGDKLKQVSLWEVLDIFPGANHFICYRDYIDGLEYIRSCKEISERGLYFELGAFKYKVLLDFYEVIDSDEYPWAKVAHELKGNGVPSLEFVMREIKYGSILHPYREAVNRGSLNWLASGYEKGKIRKEVKETFKQKADNLINAVIKFEKLKTDVLIKSDLQNVYKAILTLPNLNESGISGVKSLKKEITEFMTAFLKSEETTKLNRLEILIHILFTKILYELYVNHPDAHVQNYFIENRAFVTVIKEVLIQYLPDDYQGDVMNNLIQVLAGKCNLPDLTDDKLPFFENLFSDSAAQKFLMMNQFEEVIYFNKERFEELLDWCFIQYLILETDRAIKSGKLSSGKINNLWTMFKRLKNTAEISGYRYEDFMDKINKR